MNTRDGLKLERGMKERLDEEDVAGADEVESGALTASVLWEELSQ